MKITGTLFNKVSVLKSDQSSIDVRSECVYIVFRQEFDMPLVFKLIIKVKVNANQKWMIKVKVNVNQRFSLAPCVIHLI